MWITNLSNGTIDGAENISTWLNVSFYFENNLSATTADSIITQFTAMFPDSTSKNFTIAYGTGQNNITIRGYPDFYTATINSIEIYSKTDYTTRSRFMVSASTNLSIQQNASIYFLDDSNANYAIINVIDAGDAVSNAYIQVLKYYSNGSLYINVDQKVTNSEGKAAGYYDVYAYYRFVVSDSDGDVIYTSTGPEQFIIENSIYQVTLDVADQDPIDLITPYAVAGCEGNETANAIIFDYADGTGLANQVRFLAYRANSTTPVCNQTISGSSASHVCYLSGGENLSLYPYTCEVWREASPWWLDLVNILDFRSLTGNSDWQIIAIFLIVVLAGAVAHVAIGFILGGISLFAIDAIGIYPLGYDVTLPIMVVGFVLAWLAARR